MQTPLSEWDCLKCKQTKKDKGKVVVREQSAVALQGKDGEEQQAQIQILPK